MKSYLLLKDRLLKINKKGFAITEIGVFILGIFLSITFAIVLVPDMIGNLTTMGYQNLTTGALANGSVCGELECVYAMQQAQGTTMNIGNVILGLIVILGTFLALASYLGFKGIKLHGK